MGLGWGGDGIALTMNLGNPVEAIHKRGNTTNKKFNFIGNLKNVHSNKISLSSVIVAKVLKTLWPVLALRQAGTLLVAEGTGVSLEDNLRMRIRGCKVCI